MAKHTKKARKPNAPAKHPYRPQSRAQQVQPPPQQHKGKARPQASQAAPVPFEVRDDVLLVGEGDFSFAHCLHTHFARQYNTLTATTLESQDELYEKYPQARNYVATLTGDELSTETYADPEHALRTSNGPRRNGTGGLDVEKQDWEEDAVGFQDDTSDFEGFSPPSSSALSSPVPRALSARPNVTTPTMPTTIHYTIDATRLTSYKALRPIPYSIIVFNFPHVGGKSTDVNRQVRANQEMLQKFLGEGKATLVRGVALRSQRTRNSAGKTEAQGAGEGMSRAEKKSERYDTDEENDGSEDDAKIEQSGGAQGTSNGQPIPTILVTLFEGEPYTLWNIKDLARSVGLECRRSWKFDWSMWPGYGHARTLGNLRQRAVHHHRTQGEEEVDAELGHDARDGGGDEEGTVRKEQTKSKARGPGWKGEQRDARTYEFGLKGWDERGKRGGKRKRSGRGSDSD